MTYGCHGRKPHKTHQVVPDGHFADGYARPQKLTHMPVRGSPDCQYTHSELGQADPRCRGCTWRHDESTPTADTPQEK